MPSSNNPKYYHRGRTFAISGILSTTLGLVTYFLGGAMLYFGILFLMGMLLGFIGALFILLSMRKPKN